VILGDGEGGGVACEAAGLACERGGEVVADAEEVDEVALREEGGGGVEVAVSDELQGEGEEAADAGEEEAGGFEVAGFDGVGDHGAVVEVEEGVLEGLEVVSLCEEV
jgi:hypothetical protein